MKRFIPVFTVITVCLVLIGCNRKYYVSFVNTSSEDCSVSITGPDGVTHELGTVEKKFGFQHLGVVVWEDKELEEIPPVCITWQCGEKQAAILLDEYSHKNIWIGLPEGEYVNPRKIIETLTTNESIFFKQKQQSAKKEERVWVSY